jgi:hypothetical protein
MWLQHEIYLVYRNVLFEVKSILQIKLIEELLKPTSMFIIRAGKNHFLPGSTTWRQTFHAIQRSTFVLNLHVHKHIIVF